MGTAGSSRDCRLSSCDLTRAAEGASTWWGWTPYHTTVRAPINMALPWHKSIAQIADLNQLYVTGKLSKTLKTQNPLSP